MQPYFFPYLGYFQLMAAVDVFVVYDDVAFIKGGWINRNRLLLNGQPWLFTVPLQGASQNRLIHQIEVSPGEYPRWRDKFLKTVARAYARAPHYAVTFTLLERVLDQPAANIGDLARRSLLAVHDFLSLPTRIGPSSTCYQNGHLRAQDRVLDICAREGATAYYNPPGGRELYSQDDFAARGLTLRFLRSRLPGYRQFDHPFVPALSIIDVLMFNPPESVRAMLPEYDLEA